jgi:hypothetical protein
MRFLRTLHLYLGCLFAPTLIFFSVTGSWQLFNWHESTKDHLYGAASSGGSFEYPQGNAPARDSSAQVYSLALFHRRCRDGAGDLNHARSDHGISVQPASPCRDHLFVGRNFCPGNRPLDLQIRARLRHGYCEKLREQAARQAGVRGGAGRWERSGRRELRIH